MQDDPVSRPATCRTAADVTSTVCYTIDGHYGDAGLSLPAADPVLDFIRIAKEGVPLAKDVNATLDAVKAARVRQVAKVANASRLEPLLPAR